MPSDRLQTRLLPRASARLISLLLLWWFFLVNPLLFLWRGAAEASGSVFYGGGAGELVIEAPSGDWSFRVPMEIGVPPSPRQPAGARGREGPFHRVRHAAAGRHRVHLQPAGLRGDHTGGSRNPLRHAAADSGHRAAGDSENHPAPLSVQAAWDWPSAAPWRTAPLAVYWPGVLLPSP